MKIKFLKQYRKKETGRLVFVYSVSGTAAQIKAYKEAMGERLVEDNGVCLWFTTRFIGNSGSLIMTSENKVIADTSALDQAQSLVDQFPGALGQEIARQFVGNLLGGSNASAPVSTPANAGKIDK